MTTSLECLETKTSLFYASRALSETGHVLAKQFQLQLLGVPWVILRPGVLDVGSNPGRDTYVLQKDT